MLLLLWMTLSASSAEPDWYAKQQRVASEVRDPNPFSRTGWKTTWTSSWSLVSMVRSGEDVAYDELLCGVETSRVHGATVTYPAAFIQSVGTRHHKARLSGQGPGARFEAGPFVQVLGAAPDVQALPTQPDDPTVIDGDLDGKPGITVQVSQVILGSGEAYVAARSVTTFDGELQADGSIVGRVAVDDESVLLDATSWWLKLGQTKRAHVDPSLSTFVWAPLASSTTCEDLLARREALFGVAAP